MSIDTLERTYVETRTSDIPAESSHIVQVPKDEKDETPHAYVLRARIEGFPIVAICGHVFIPQKDAKPLPVCSACLDIYQSEDRSDDSGDGLPDA